MNVSAKVTLSISMSPLFVMAKEYIIIIVYSYCEMAIGFRKRYNSNEMVITLSYDNDHLVSAPLK